MSNENFEFNIDDILAEFYADEKAASAGAPVTGDRYQVPGKVSREQRAVSREKLRAQSSELRG